MPVSKSLYTRQVQEALAFTSSPSQPHREKSLYPQALAILSANRPYQLMPYPVKLKLFFTNCNIYKSNLPWSNKKTSTNYTINVRLFLQRIFGAYTRPSRRLCVFFLRLQRFSYLEPKKNRHIGQNTVERWQKESSNRLQLLQKIRFLWKFRAEESPRPNNVTWKDKSNPLKLTKGDSIALIEYLTNRRQSTSIKNQNKEYQTFKSLLAKRKPKTKAAQ